MRRTTNLSVTALAAGLALGAAAQTRDTGPTPQNRSIITAEAPRAAPTESKTAQALEFLADALRTGLAEVELGKLAAERGHDARLREYGAKLEADHTAHVAEIERLLQPLDVTIPDEPSTEALLHHAALARLSGEEFDAAFVEMMIASHTEAIEEYGAQTHANPDRALSAFASKSLPMLREHLQIAESLR